MAADHGAARPADPLEELRRELDEARGILRTIGAGGVDALVIDSGSGEEVFRLRGALEELRRALDEAQDTLRIIRADGFDALFIGSGNGEEVFTLSGAERPYRLLIEGVAGGALSYFRAVAADFDGTLAEGPVAPDTLAALAEARGRGIRVILVTGRIMSELRAVFPEVDHHVDAVVAENGALVVTRTGVRQLAGPVGRAVSAALATRGVDHRNGQVLVACAAADEPAASEVIRELGLDCQLVRNRGELMILPAAVTKGTGLLETLADLGLSPRNTIGVGDAENDHSLLDACEIGVAVANAVDAIRAHADIVLTLPDGQGLAELLRGPLLAGRAHAHPRRWQITLGLDDRGEAVTLPASQLDVAVCGGTGQGKSYLAGLICEQLVRLGYSLIVFDPEGDHLGLGELRGMFVTGGQEGRLAGPAEVVQLLRHSHGSVIVDLSHLDAAVQADYAAGLVGEVGAHRAATGLPQWVAVDEAHGPIGRTASTHRLFDPAAKGYLLVTWQPKELSADALAALDAVITLSSPHPTASSSTWPRRWPICPVPRSPGSSKGRPAARCWPGGSTPAGRWRSPSGPGALLTCAMSINTTGPASSPPAASTSGPSPAPPTGRSPATSPNWKPSSAAATGGAAPPLPRPRLLQLDSRHLPRRPARRRHRRRRSRPPSPEPGCGRRTGTPGAHRGAPIPPPPLNHTISGCAAGVRGDGLILADSRLTGLPFTMLRRGCPARDAAGGWQSLSGFQGGGIDPRPGRSALPCATSSWGPGSSRPGGVEAGVVGTGGADGIGRARAYRLADPQQLLLGARVLQGAGPGASHPSRAGADDRASVRAEPVKALSVRGAHPRGPARWSRGRTRTGRGPTCRHPDEPGAHHGGGGLSTKIHLAADRRCRPVIRMLSPASTATARNSSC